jgi:hypothetical protein
VTVPQSARWSAVSTPACVSVCYDNAHTFSFVPFYLSRVLLQLVT